jgi:hypothetical protein
MHIHVNMAQTCWMGMEICNCNLLHSEGSDWEQSIFIVFSCTVLVVVLFIKLYSYLYMSFLYNGLFCPFTRTLYAISYNITICTTILSCFTRSMWVVDIWDAGNDLKLGRDDNSCFIVSADSSSAVLYSYSTVQICVLYCVPYWKYLMLCQLIYQLGTFHLTVAICILNPYAQIKTTQGQRTNGQWPGQLILNYTIPISN